MENYNGLIESIDISKMTSEQKQLTFEILQNKIEECKKEILKFNEYGDFNNVAEIVFVKFASSYFGNDIGYNFIIDSYFKDLRCAYTQKNSPSDVSTIVFFSEEKEHEFKELCSNLTPKTFFLENDANINRRSEKLDTKLADIFGIKPIFPGRKITYLTIASLIAVITKDTNPEIVLSRLLAWLEN